MSDKKNNLINLFERIKFLEAENQNLIALNEELLKKVNSKRYRLIDGVITPVQKLIPKKKAVNKTIETESIEDDKKEEPQVKTIKGLVYIINISFYDWDGEILNKGGAERYVYDLACVVKKMGLKPKILQCSNGKFKKNLNGIVVEGIGAGDPSDIKTTSALYNEYCKDAELVIASPLELACSIVDVPVIGINHGVTFDGNRENGNQEDCLSALDKVKKCVCVDTNFINWTRTKDYELSLKERFIPNYYDQKEFEAIKEKKNNDKITIIYPRRLHEARGYDLVMRVFPRIVEKYGEKVVLNFVGQVNSEKANKMLTELKQQYPKNVFHYEFDKDEMKQAYTAADIALIPTKYCEGTSLSCIEAMASGVALIVTNVGGLPNLVIDDFNGKIISPVEEDLESAICELIEDKKLRKKLIKNGLEVASSSFNKSIWEQRWIKEISSMID